MARTRQPDEHRRESRGLRLGTAAALALTFVAAGQAQKTGDTYLPWEGGSQYYKQWSLGPPPDQDYFPIAVWLQSPSNAGLYKGINVNLFIGLWDGTVEYDPVDGPILPLLRQYGMPVFGDQETGLSGPDAPEHLTDPIIEGWTQMDEPDNAQWNSNTQTYDPCIAPAAIINTYGQYQAADPNRPVYLNLGQGVAFDPASPYVGRGEECNYGVGRGLADYPKYIQGADIVSSDCYPDNDHNPLWWVGKSVDRLRKWASYKKPAWQWIELVNFNNDPTVTVPVADIKSEVWMTIIHGGLGFGYFCHQFAPVFEEDALFFPEHADVLAMVTAINIQVTALARVLNTPSVANGVSVASSNVNSPIDFVLKRYGGSTFLLAMGGKDGGPATGTFKLRDFPPAAAAAVLGENRRIVIRHGVFQDNFAQYGVHLYQIFFDPNAKSKLGDVDGDGKVTMSDLMIVKAALGKSVGQPGYDPRADVIRDGTVDHADLALVQEQMLTGRSH